MDNLEKFIKAHQDDLNNVSPKGNAWEQIASRLQPDELERFVTAHRTELDQDAPSAMVWSSIAAVLESGEIEPIVAVNREQFDTAMPPATVWERVLSRLNGQYSTSTMGKKVSFWAVTPARRVAASVIILVAASLGFYFGQAFSGQEVAEIAAIQPEQVDLAKIAPEVSEAEQYYTQLVSEKQQEIGQLQAKDPQVAKDFDLELQKLDSAYATMKVELVESQGNEMVVGAMIQNLQLRIEILNRQLIILQQIQQYKNGNNNAPQTSL